MRAPRLYVITDRHAAGDRSLVDVIAAAAGAVPEGALWVQLREKDLDGGALCVLARSLLPVVRARGGELLVNDRVDVALAAGAGGVHLPESGFTVATARALMPAGRIGASTHAAGAAAATEADFALIGPVWDTPSKRGFGPPLGEAALADACAGTSRPILAVGGIDGPARAAAARAAGAFGVAVIRAIMAAGDPAAAAAELYEALA